MSPRVISDAYKNKGKVHTLQHTYINKVIADMYVSRLGRCLLHQNKCSFGIGGIV